MTFRQLHRRFCSIKWHDDTKRWRRKWSCI